MMEVFETEPLRPGGIHCQNTHESNNNFSVLLRTEDNDRFMQDDDHISQTSQVEIRDSAPVVLQRVIPEVCQCFSASRSDKLEIAHLYMDCVLN